MLRKGRVAVLLFLLWGTGIFAQTVSLSGTVTNKSGKPIAGATVKLVLRNITTQTDANGKYLITSTSSKNFQILPLTEQVSMEKGIVCLSLSKPSKVKIELFDMRGKRGKRILEDEVDRGNYRFNLPTHTLATGVIVVRISIEGHIFTFRYLPEKIGEGFSSKSSGKFIGKNENSNNARLEAILDTLKVSASGYLEYTEALSSLQGVKNITLDSIALPRFSFFVTSLKAIQELSGSPNGFGGDLRFGKKGEGAGLLGADSICECIAERSMPGSKVKQWRAFLSAKKGPDGKQVNAIERIGKGPWYDRLGRLVANNVSELLNTRPINADPVIKNDLPNEDGVPNHYPDPNQPNTPVDNHHIVTGSNTEGKLYTATGSSTCDDWTSTTASGKPRCGFSWPRGTGTSASHWISGFDCCGCAAGIQITQSNNLNTNIIGCAGGYGGFYCFALNP